MQADAEHNGSVGGLFPICLGHCLLELDGSAHCIDGARKLGQSSIAGEFDQPAAVARQHRFEALLTVFSQACQRAALVPTHQAGIAHHIGGNDGC